MYLQIVKLPDKTKSFENQNIEKRKLEKFLSKSDVIKEEPMRLVAELKFKVWKKTLLIGSIPVWFTSRHRFTQNITRCQFHFNGLITFLFPQIRGRSDRHLYFKNFCYKSQSFLSLCKEIWVDFDLLWNVQICKPAKCEICMLEGFFFILSKRWMLVVFFSR